MFLMTGSAERRALAVTLCPACGGPMLHLLQGHELKVASRHVATGEKEDPPPNPAPREDTPAAVPELPP
jgi:hypothetical protein